MNKLEHYLQQVCRSMGGPKALREHVRQELREHLLDAISQHQTAGLSEQQAIDRALAEFGTPETVRSELEATHGHRMMLAMVIDKAMEWKEKTMKAKWLWATWTYLMVVGIIVLEILFTFFCMLYVLPKIKKLKNDGMFMADENSKSLINWMFDFVWGWATFIDQWMWWVILFLLSLWGLFEWRVKSENKTFMRLSVLCSLALGLAVVVTIMSASMVLPFLVTMPTVGRLTRPWMAKQLNSIDRSIDEAGKAARKADRPLMAQEFKNISDKLKALSSGPVFTTWMKWGDDSTVDAMQKTLELTQEQVKLAQGQLGNKDDSILEKLIRDIEKAYEPLKRKGKLD